MAKGDPYGGYVSQGGGDRFLGKEVEFYKLIYEYLNAIKIAAINQDNNRFIMLVSVLDSTFPYKDEAYQAEIVEATKVLKSELSNSKNKYGREEQDVQSAAMLNFTQSKYNALVGLFKRKKVFPQEAEEEWL